MVNSKVIIGVVIAVAIVIGVFAMNNDSSNNDVTSETSNNDVTSETSGLGDQINIEESPKKHVIIIGDAPTISEG